MAGRSGAAALEVALQEAATGFDARALAKTVRSGARPDAEALASALEAAQSRTPLIQPREFEVLTLTLILTLTLTLTLTLALVQKP